MTGSGYQNFDYGLARKIMDLLKVTKNIIKNWCWKYVIVYVVNVVQFYPWLKVNTIYGTMLKGFYF